MNYYYIDISHITYFGNNVLPLRQHSRNSVLCLMQFLIFDMTLLDLKFTFLILVAGQLPRVSTVRKARDWPHQVQPQRLSQPSVEKEPALDGRPPPVHHCGQQLDPARG